MVLLLKRFLVQAYHVKEEMLQTFNPAGKKCGTPVGSCGPSLAKLAALQISSD